MVFSRTSSLTLYQEGYERPTSESSIRHSRYPPPVRNSTKFKLSTRMIYLRTVESMQSTTQSTTCSNLDIQIYNFEWPIAIADTAMLDRSSLTWTRTRTRPQTIRMGIFGKKSRALEFSVLWRTRLLWLLIICVIFGGFFRSRLSIVEVDPVLVKAMPPRQRVEMPQVRHRKGLNSVYIDREQKGSAHDYQALNWHY